MKIVAKDISKVYNEAMGAGIESEQGLPESEDNKCAKCLKPNESSDNSKTDRCSCPPEDRFGLELPENEDDKTENLEPSETLAGKDPN